jgi:hypothetical protein
VETYISINRVSYYYAIRKTIFVEGNGSLQDTQRSDDLFRCETVTELEKVMPDKKNQLAFTNAELAKAWRAQQIDHLPTMVRSAKPYILFKVDMKKADAEKEVVTLKKSMIRAIAVQDKRTGAHERYDVWISTKR